jgi:haloalkane dehalogenase
VPILRTPDERFENLPDYPFTPRYVEVENPDGGSLRMHYLDEGPADATVVLLLHGEPSWSFLYRKMIPVIVAAGYRALAPDYIGFGRSDKLSDPTDYTYARHVGWIAELVVKLDLRAISLFGQDWGGAVGLSVVAREERRFDRLILGNTMLHTLDPELRGQLEWPAYSAESTSVLSESLLDWIVFSQRSRDFRPSRFIDASTLSELPEAVASAYDAPYPDARYLAGARQFPILIPITRSDPGARMNRSTWKALEKFEKPVLTAFSDSDPSTRGWERVFQRRIPGAANQSHATITGAGHFLQEDKGEELANVIVEFISTSTP